MHTETWYKIMCHSCTTINWMCDGDTSDITAMDLDGFTCRGCQRKHSFDPDMPSDLDNDNYPVGIEDPNCSDD